MTEKEKEEQFEGFLKTHISELRTLFDNKLKSGCLPGDLRDDQKVALCFYSSVEELGSEISTKIKKDGTWLNGMRKHMRGLRHF